MSIRMNRRTLLASAAGGVLALPFTSRGRAVAQAAKTVVLGGSIPLTGAAAETGMNVFAGYKTLVKFINEELKGFDVGGERVTFELNMIDDASEAQRATTLIQRQIDEGIEFFLGSFSSQIVLPTAAITERAGKVMVQTGGGSDQIFSQGFQSVFGMYPRASRSVYPAVDAFLSMDPKPQSAVVIYTNDPFSRLQADGVTAYIKEQGMNLLETYSLPAEVTDVSGVLASIRELKPDVALCVTHDQNSQLITAQMAATNTNVKGLFQVLGPATENYRKSLGNKADDIFAVTSWSEDMKYGDDIVGTAKDFANYYRKVETRPLVFHVVNGAQCIMIYMRAMQAAGSLEPMAVRDAIKGLDIMTFGGPIQFMPEGDGHPVKMGLKIAQVQKGELKVVFPKEVAAASAIWPMTPWDAR
ncbi:amino acid ABC transporter substrate-binding protein [Corticibacterium sp. UT-5YL-CI-8]|nr:amino acid ABC transporter substrate-binding protein [Tianweitania sp. UT-5YL-CI-8]